MSCCDFSTRAGCAGRSADHARAFRTFDRPEIGDPCERAVSAVSAVNAAGDFADPLPGPGASIPLAGKCRREGCVSKRHFAAPGVARRIGGGDIIAREEPRG